MKAYQLLLLLLFAMLTTPTAQGAGMKAGAGRFDFTHASKTLPVWYYVPANAKPDTAVLFVMHGVKRDAERYRDEWLPHAKERGFILVTPEFSEKDFPGSDGYNTGNMTDAKDKPLPRTEWSFSFLEPIFDAVKAATGNRSERYSIYGHSAGAQFVHRYMYFMPEARVSQAIAANAGWWTLPDLKVKFPYGLRGSVADEAALKALLQRPLVVLLGTADTDPHHANLRRTPEAMEQGEHRYARGQTFFATGQKQAKALGVPLGWKLATAPGVGHVDKDMAPFAVEILFSARPLSKPAPSQKPAAERAPLRETLIGRDPAHLRVLFGGDTNHGESYQDEYGRTSEGNILEKKGYEHGLGQLSKLLKAVDYRILNLETPLTAKHESPLAGKDYLHYSDPVKSPAAFQKYGPIAYSLANNHTLDQGAEGLADTSAALKAAGAQSFGAGASLAEAATPLIQKCRVGEHAFTLAVFGAFEYRKNYDEDFHFYAGGGRPGVAPVDVAAAKTMIAELKRNAPDAFVVYFVHWGDNYAWKSKEQTETAQALRAAGVDLLIGHGAHTMQEIERDEKGWIFYSLGNFLFNARGRYKAHQAPPYSLPLVLDFSMKDGRLKTTLRVYPILSDNQVTGYQPRFVTEQELGEISTLLGEKSGWGAAARAAVKQGSDAIGSYLEFSE
ncbi:CapA family protein [Prosthecobacter sp.]|uniref:CapA family protein n=1 Tax=Prosthecobacter sp. TaxID=1965333 RepID=UPI003784AF5D